MIKNYTSTVPAARSVQHIEDKLVAHGATRIMKEYDDEKLTGICFVIDVKGKEVPFKLPARTQECEKVLRGAVKRSNSDTYARIAKQAERTAWKLLSDWTDVQMSLIELGQVELMEIFLPYIYNFTAGKTYYEILKDKGFRGLLEAPKS